MFSGGIVTVFVTDMDRSVRFYTEQLGLKLLKRYENHFATIDGGNGMTIGLHPAEHVAPAAAGGMSIGLYLSGKMNDAIKTLEARGISFVPSTDQGKAGRFVHFADPDGNQLYLAEMKPEYKDESVGVR
jgi:catechol 2,3-dioxygenase-like lactoylglutathione lyase family enzyme